MEERRGGEMREEEREMREEREGRRGRKRGGKERERQRMREIVISAAISQKLFSVCYQL